MITNLEMIGAQPQDEQPKLPSLHYDIKLVYEFRKTRFYSSIDLS